MLPRLPRMGDLAGGGGPARPKEVGLEPVDVDRGTALEQAASNSSLVLSITWSPTWKVASTWPRSSAALCSCCAACSSVRTSCSKAFIRVA